MEFDQSFVGATADWSFPSPTTTPTDGSFGPNGFQTPKTASLQSHFHDAFLTPQMNSYDTPLQPQYASITPAQRPQTSSETLRSNYMANIHASGGQVAGQVMAPPGHGFSLLSPIYGHPHAASMQTMNTSFDSTQMQTPPPTRGTSSRKALPVQQVAFGTPSTITSRRIVTPQQAVIPASSQLGAQPSPMHFPQLQFSPDMYQLANIGPASAPVMPQSRILWDSGSPMQPVPTTINDPFAPASANFVGWPIPSTHHSGVQNVSFDTPAMGSYPLIMSHVTPATAISPSFSTTPAAIHEPSTAGVDPSLLYSSPCRPILRSNSRSKDRRVLPQKGDDKQRPTRAVNHKRSDTVSSGDTTISATSAAQHRNKNTTISRPRSALPATSATESLRGSSSLSHIPRTDSPVSRLGRSVLDSISEGRQNQRKSVILTVDENGRARTETTRVEESPAKSIRERYPALYDSESSDTESDKSDNTPSRSTSFISTQHDERRSKAARLDPPIEDLAGLTIPRSNSSASLRKGIPPSRAAVAAAAQLRRQSSLRRSSSNRTAQPKKTLTSSASASMIDTCPMDGQSEYPPSNPLEGNFAWHPPSNIFVPPPTGAERALEGYNRRWSMMSFEQQHQQIPSTISPQHPTNNYQTALFPDQQNLRHHPPPQYHSQPPPQQQLLIRCQCGVPDDRGQPLVQCRSCTQWLHAACVGSSPGEQDAMAGRSFTCFLCTRPAPSRAVGTGQMFSAG